MQSGKLRHRIELKSAAKTLDSYGQQTEVWTTYATVWAQIKPLAGRELETAKQISEKIDYEIRIRYNATVTSEHRAYFGTRIFEITSVINIDERNKETLLYCTEIK